MSFGARLKSARGSLTQKELAEKIGCTESAVQLWESDKGLPSGKFLQAMSVLLNIDTNLLLRGSVNSIPLVDRTIPGGVKDADGLYGRTEQKEVDGKKFSMTIYGEDQSAADPFAMAVSGLREIFDSEDLSLIRAITANVEAFRDSARKDRRLNANADRMTKLEDECEDLKRRLSDLEAKIKPPGHEPASGASGVT